MTAENHTLNRGLYRSRNGWILGVCRGLAESRGLSVFWTRVIAVILLVATSFWPVIILYLAAALILKPEPALPFKDEDDLEFYNSFTSSRRLALARLKRTYDHLDRRIQRMETHVTDREYSWDRRFRE